MFTYIVSSVIMLIALGCIFRKQEHNSSAFLAAIVLFLFVTIITSVVVTSIRKDSLKIEDTVSAVIDLYPFVIGQDSVYVKIDTIKNDKSYTLNVTKLDTLPKGSKGFILHTSDIKTGVIFSKDSNIALKRLYDNKYDTLYYGYPDSIVIDTVTYLEKHSVDSIGDNWTVSWALPSIQTYTLLHLKQKDYNYLALTNSKLIKKWKIAKR
jgi:hypothetical protein